MGGRLLILFDRQNQHRALLGLRDRGCQRHRYTAVVLAFLLGVGGGCAQQSPSPPEPTVTVTISKPAVIVQPEPIPQPQTADIIEEQIMPSLAEIAEEINAAGTDSYNASLGWQQLELLLLQQDSPLQAVQTHLSLDPMLTDPQARSTNHQQIWDRLQQLSDLELNSARMPLPNVLTGWIDLVLIKRNRVLLAIANQPLRGWRVRYPDHPANETFASQPSSLQPDLEQQSIATSLPIQKLEQVALLLPFSGRYERQAGAIRDGFLAAWFADAVDPKPTQIQLYDTSPDGVLTAYEQALAAGNKLIIGPLLKDAIATLLCSVPITVPMLALNRISATSFDLDHLQECIPEAATNFLYQFALSPENEAQLAARRSFYDGHSHTLAFAPEGSWGQRVLDAFVAEFERLGGLVIEKIRYSPDATDMSPLVAVGLQIDHSNDRRQALEQVLQRDLHHRSYRREDVDSIFMLAFAQPARRLRPLFDFYRAHELPIYATSHVYAKVQNPTKNSDLNRVQFGDMPWVLNPADTARGLQLDLQQAWPDASIKINRLHAFGADAYRLIEPIHQTADKKINLPGYTGELVMANNGPIHRRLLWAHFVDGIPQLIDVEARPQAEP